MTTQAVALPDRINSMLRQIPTWVVYLSGTLPAIYITVGVALALTGTYDIFGDSLGIDPAKTIEHWLGELAIQFFIATLMISVLRDILGIKLIKFRRALGLLTFLYVTLHLMIWIGLDLQFRWGEIWTDILKRPYITIGMVAFAFMLPLAATSFNSAIRKLGPHVWQQLHKLTYPAIVLGGIHYVMVQKVWEAKPLIYLVVILALVAFRRHKLLPRRR